MLPSRLQWGFESAVADSQEWVVLVWAGVIAVGYSLRIGLELEVVVGADLDSRVESDTMRDTQPEQLVGAPGIVDAELLLQPSRVDDLESVRVVFEVEKGQIALSDSLLVVPESPLAIVVGLTASGSSSERQCSVAETASDSTVRAGATARVGCSDPLLEVQSVRTSRHARRPSVKPESTAALVAATSPAHLRARPSATSSLRNPFLKT